RHRPSCSEAQVWKFSPVAARATAGGLEVQSGRGTCHCRRTQRGFNQIDRFGGDDVPPLLRTSHPVKVVVLGPILSRLQPLWASMQPQEHFACAAPQRSWDPPGSRAKIDRRRRSASPRFAGAIGAAAEEAGTDEASDQAPARQKYAGGFYLFAGSRSNAAENQ
ncbi:unnamed protein product, partial [Symbiodinium sp. CCMP2592]